MLHVGVIFGKNLFCNFCDTVKILDEIDEHGIKIYHLPDAESDEDEDFKEQTRILKVALIYFLQSSSFTAFSIT